MEEQDNRSLHDRVAALEDAVDKLQRLSERISHQLSLSEQDASPDKPEPVEPPGTYVQQKTDLVQPAAAKPAHTAVARKKPEKKSFELPENMRKSEYWLNKIGIGLILFAVIFLFKYSIDQGWLTPLIRIIFGLVLGTALLTIGFRLYRKKKHFSQVLTGGAIATYYITGFAAFRMFELVSHPVAFGFMIAVTVLSFLISLRQDEGVFSLIGTLGGLVTPFLLYTGSGDIPGLMIYTCLILAGTSAIYFYQGWRLLLWLSIIGGWLIIMIGLADSSVSFTSSMGDQWAFQWAIITCWILFWIVPLSREIARIANPDRWRRALIGIGDKPVSSSTDKVLDSHIFLITIFVPFISLALSTTVWPDLSKENWGWINLALSSIYMAANIFIRRWPDLKNLAFTHVILSLMFFTIAVSLMLEGDTLFITLATEAAVLHLAAMRISSRGISIFGHALFFICALVMMDRLYLTELYKLFESPEGTAIFNARALSDLWVLGLGVLMSFRLKTLFEKRAYLVAVFVFAGAWLCRELDGNIEFVVILAEAALIHFIAKKMNDRAYAVIGHSIFILIGIWLVIRMLKPDTDATAILNAHAIVNLLPILAAAGIYKFLRTGWGNYVYRLIAHIAFLGWFVSEFGPLENGQGYITIAWGIYAALLLVAGLHYNYPRLRTVSMVTLFIVVGKLFLVDLAKLEVLWRILLFMGFGGLFLFLSYYFQDLWKGKTETEDESK